MSIPTHKKSRPAGEALWARRQEEILEVAVQLFAEHGYSNADTQLLAERLGVGKGTLYRYFECKRELFLAAVDRVMRQLLAAVLEKMSPVADPLERLRIGIIAFLSFFEANPAFVELLIQERALFKDRKKPTFQEHREANVDRWRPLYQSLIDAGRMRNIPTDRCLSVVGNLLYGTIFTNYVAGQTKAACEQAHDLVDVLFNGLLSESERGVFQSDATSSMESLPTNATATNAPAANATAANPPAATATATNATTTSAPTPLPTQ